MKKSTCLVFVLLFIAVGISYSKEIEQRTFNNKEEVVQWLKKKYRWVYHGSSRYISVCNNKSSEGLYDTTGRCIVPLNKFKMITRSREGNFFYLHGRNYETICDSVGNILVPYPVYENICVHETNDGCFISVWQNDIEADGVYDSYGNLIFPYEDNRRAVYSLGRFFLAYKNGNNIYTEYGLSNGRVCHVPFDKYTKNRERSSRSNSSSNSNTRTSGEGNSNRIYSKVSSAITQFGGYNWDIPNLEELDPITVKRIQDNMVQQRVASGGNIDFLLDPNFAIMQVNQQNQSSAAFTNRMIQMSVEQACQKIAEEKALFISNFKQSFRQLYGRLPDEYEINEALCQYYEIQANVARKAKESYHEDNDYKDEYKRWESVAEGAAKSLTCGGSLYEDSEGNIKGSTNKLFDGSTYPYLKLQQIRKDAQSKMREVRQKAASNGTTINKSNWESATITY